MHISEDDRQIIGDWARGQPEIKKVYLYGSRARGDHRPDSDIDLAIEINATTADEAFATWTFWRQEFQKRPSLRLENKLHLQWYHPDAGLDRVGPGVENDGILLYST